MPPITGGVGPSMVFGSGGIRRRPGGLIRAREGLRGEWGLEVMLAVGSILRATALSAVAVMALPVALAFAGDCNGDIAGLTAKRQTFIEQLNVLSKKSKGKLDPVASCPTLRGLVSTESNLIKYLEANKNWCNVPDEVLANLKTADVKSQQFATQACNFATQAKAAQQKQASGNALGTETQKLPTGPL